MTALIYVGVVYVIASSIIQFTMPSWMKFIKLFAGIMVVIALSPVITFFGRLGDDIHEVGQVYTGAKQGIAAVTSGVNTVTSWPETKENIPIVGTGASKHPPGITLIERLRPSTIRFDMPVAGNITQEFKGADHHGIDIGCNEGSVVKVARKGKVVSVGEDKNIYGNFILIDHGAGWQTLYAHLSKISVSKGDHIWGNTAIGLSGGKKGEQGAGNSEGPHLHFEIRVGNAAIDPAKYLK